MTPGVVYRNDQVLFIAKEPVVCFESRNIAFGVFVDIGDKIREHCFFMRHDGLPGINLIVNDFLSAIPRKQKASARKQQTEQRAEDQFYIQLPNQSGSPSPIRS